MRHGFDISVRDFVQEQRVACGFFSERVRQLGRKLLAPQRTQVRLDVCTAQTCQLDVLTRAHAGRERRS